MVLVPASETPRCATLPRSLSRTLAPLLEPHHGADRILDRHRIVDAVDVIKIDVIGAEPPEAFVTGLRHVIGVAFGAGLSVREPYVAELGREDIFVPPSFDRAPDEFFICTIRPIGIGRIDEIDPYFRGTLQGRERLVRVGQAIDRRHAHAAEPDCRYVQSPKLPAFHHVTVPSRDGP